MSIIHLNVHKNAWKYIYSIKRRNNYEEVIRNYINRSYGS